MFYSLALSFAFQFLYEGSDLEARDVTEGTTALHLAAFGGYYTAVQLLVNAGANVHASDQDGATPLVRAAALRLPFGSALRHT